MHFFRLKLLFLPVTTSVTTTTTALECANQMGIFQMDTCVTTEKEKIN